MIHILFLEDDAELNQRVCNYLNDSGFFAKGCRTIGAARDEVYNNRYELIISDIIMPEISGFEFAQEIHKMNKHIPFLFIAAKEEMPSRQKEFRLGIDDYMIKPIDLEELLLRVRALLRRAGIKFERKLTVGNIEMDADSMSVKVDGEEIQVTIRGFHILYKLLSYPGRPLSRAQLMDEFWNAESETSPRAVDVYVTKLRDKFSKCNGFKIVTVRGYGYKSVLI